MSAKLSVELRLFPFPPGIAIAIDGRQALKEGPRRVGQCVYCGGPCEGVTTLCEERVFRQARR